MPSELKSVLGTLHLHNSSLKVLPFQHSFWVFLFDGFLFFILFIGGIFWCCCYSIGVRALDGVFVSLFFGSSLFFFSND